MEIDRHIGCAMSGLTADARTMVDHARVTSQMHAFTYDESIGVESCTQAVCDLALRFGESVEDDDALMVSPRCLMFDADSSPGHSALRSSLRVLTRRVLNCTTPTRLERLCATRPRRSDQVPTPPSRACRTRTTR